MVLDASLQPPTENANPVVLAVVGSNRPRHGSALQIPELAVWMPPPTATKSASAENDNDWEYEEENWMSHQRRQKPTAEDRAVRQALVDASCATNGKSVSLLRHLGLDILSSVSDSEERETETANYKSISSPPWFVPAEQLLPSKTCDTRDTPASSAATPPIATLENKETAPPVLTLDPDEVYEMIRNIQDPEHPHTLEELGVVSRGQIEIIHHNNYNYSTLKVRFTPTIPHCSMATQIGLAIQVKLDRSLPSGKFKTSVQIEPGTHASETAINKQLNDKERVCAALENKHLLAVVNKCIASGMAGDEK